MLVRLLGMVKFNWVGISLYGLVVHVSFGQDIARISTA